MQFKSYKTQLCIQIFLNLYSKCIYYFKQIKAFIIIEIKQRMLNVESIITNFGQSLAFYVSMDAIYRLPSVTVCANWKTRLHLCLVSLKHTQR